MPDTNKNPNRGCECPCHSNAISPICVCYPLSHHVPYHDPDTDILEDADTDADAVDDPSDSLSTETDS